RIQANLEDRCYYCKTHVFTTIMQIASADGYHVLYDGTNASDQAHERPGMRALRELEVRSPLQLAGLTKEDIRRLSQAAGIFTWNKPSYSCLATRVPTGTPLSQDVLDVIEAAEGILFDLGFVDFRCRYLKNKSTKIELSETDFSLLCKKRKQVLQELAPYFNHIMVDLKTRVYE
ncbi:MAG TPA: TIGR00268 family protein, partial [Clostridiaceae bacterium]|nr:TIGR00268 family protein [Clostridiaceae bacterium]